MKIGHDGLPELPTRAALERRLKANQRRSAKLAPGELQRRNEAYRQEQEAEAAERARIRAELRNGR